MNNGQKIRKWLPSLVSAFVLMLCGIAMIVFYYLTKYRPLYHLAVTFFMPLGVVLPLLLMLFARKKSTKAPSSAESDVLQETDGGDETKKKNAILRTLLSIGTKIKGISEEKAKTLLIVVTTTISAALFIISQFYHYLAFGTTTTLYTISYLHVVILACIFVLFLVLDKWCQHTEYDDSFAEAFSCNIRSILSIGRLSLIFTLLAMFIKLLGFYELLSYLVIILNVIFYYSSVVLLFSYVARIIRKELGESPDVRIPTPFAPGGGKDMGILSYLEANTGITMRGLWSFSLIKKLLLPACLTILALLWISTGIVEIGPGQQGALYRLGVLQDETLAPGLHINLPWPIDKTEVYDTEKVSIMSIGYVSDTLSDNVWTQTHGTEEYELLLGGGEELVSLNICVEYKIADLVAYLRNCARPESILEACSYELVTDRTIVTDLMTLLSVDREAFAKSFEADLSEKIAVHGTGIEVVSVVLESIHPPLIITDIYQQLLSAELNANTLIMEAEAKAAVNRYNAQSNYDTIVLTAIAEKHNAISKAEAEVAEFMAYVAADNESSDAYRYRKYLDAVASAYGNAKLIIVDEDVDSSRIYFGKVN